MPSHQVHRRVGHGWTAKKLDWNMPFPTLYKRLRTKTRGRILDLERGVPSERPPDVTQGEWTTFMNRKDVQEGWIDYLVPMEGS